MSNRAICRENAVYGGMSAGRRCGRFGRSERELRYEFHTQWKHLCVAFPTLSTVEVPDGVDSGVHDVETMFAFLPDSVLDGAQLIR
jgi:hypothetical protein